MKQFLLLLFTSIFLASISCTDINSSLSLDELINNNESALSPVVSCTGNKFEKKSIVYDTDLPNGLDIKESLEALGFTAEGDSLCVGKCVPKTKDCVATGIATHGTTHVVPKKKSDGTYEFVYKKPKKTGDKVQVGLKTKCACKKGGKKEAEVEIKLD